MKLNPAFFTSARGDWETPRAFFEKVHVEFNFTLDACATPRNALLPRFISQDESLPLEFGKPDCYQGGLRADALQTPWGSTPEYYPERVWLNPPYGRGIERWMRKAWEESQRGNLVVCLVPARTDTVWWHDWVQGKAEVRFVKGRLGFTIDGKLPLDSKGREQHSAPFPSVLVIYRPVPQALDSSPGSSLNAVSQPLPETRTSNE